MFRVPATVLILKKAKLPAPAVVALHSHGSYSMEGREREVGTSDAIHPSLKLIRERGIRIGGSAARIETTVDPLLRHAFGPTHPG